MPAPGKLRIVIEERPDPVITPNQSIISIREENNTIDVTYTYANLDAATLSTNQILHQEGLPNDPSATYIIVSSQSNQNITTSPGSFELHIVSNGLANQLDKVIPISIGTNTFNMPIDFRSRPQTADWTETTPNWTVPVQITKAMILAHCSDFDGDTITEWAWESGSDPNVEYNGAPYVGGTFINLDDIDANGFYYIPENNPNGYFVEYPHRVKDATGLITSLT